MRTVNTKHYTEKDIDSITIDVIRKKGERWGIELLSNEGEPSQISHVKPGSACGLSGVQAGDYILSINGVGCIDFEHEEIVDLISDAGKLLRLKVITPENLDGNIVIEGEEGDLESAEDGGGEADGGAWWLDEAVNNDMGNNRAVDEASDLKNKFEKKEVKSEGKHIDKRDDKRRDTRSDKRDDNRRNARKPDEKKLSDKNRDDRKNDDRNRDKRDDRRDDKRNDKRDDKRRPDDKTRGNLDDSRRDVRNKHERGQDDRKRDDRKTDDRRLDGKRRDDHRRDDRRDGRRYDRRDDRRDDKLDDRRNDKRDDKREDKRDDRRRPDDKTRDNRDRRQENDRKHPDSRKHDERRRDDKNRDKRDENRKDDRKHGDPKNQDRRNSDHDGDRRSRNIPDEKNSDRDLRYNNELRNSDSKHTNNSSRNRHRDKSRDHDRYSNKPPSNKSSFNKSSNNQSSSQDKYSKKYSDRNSKNHSETYSKNHSGSNTPNSSKSETRIKKSNSEQSNPRNSRNDASRKSSSDNELNPVDFESFLKLEEEEKAEKQAARSKNPKHSLKPKTGSGHVFTAVNLKASNLGIGDKIDQERFIVKHEDIIAFDKEYKNDGTFQGTRAAVAGAFTGEHNVILGQDGKTMGVKNRVLAGMQHFDYDKQKVLTDPNDLGKVLIFTTSLKVNREMAGKCETAVAIIRTTKVRYEERDIYKNENHKDRLFDMIDFVPGFGCNYPDLPIIYIDGVLIGGFNELRSLSDCGDLRIRLRDFTKYFDRAACPNCSGTGKILCGRCQGRKIMRRTAFGELKCKACGVDGYNECDQCLEDQGVVEVTF